MATTLPQKLINITISVANNLYNLTDHPTLKILKREGGDLIHRWFQAASPYLDADYLQQKWNQMNVQYNLLDNIVGCFKQFLSAVEDFSGYLIRIFNDILPPETRYEQISHWLHFGAPYLIAALVLFISTSFLFSCAGFVFRCTFMFLFWIIRLLFCCISFIVKICSYPLPAIFWCMRQLLGFGGKSAVKMMKAPGKPAMMIVRAAFEANPKAYFSALRGMR